MFLFIFNCFLATPNGITNNGHILLVIGVGAISRAMVWRAASETNLIGISLADGLIGVTLVLCIMVAPVVIGITIITTGIRFSTIMVPRLVGAVVTIVMAAVSIT